MGFSYRKNIGAYLHAAFAYASATQTAGATTEVQGPSVDRLAAGQNEPLSLSLLLAVTATLASTHTLAYAYKIQHSSDNATWTDYSVGFTTGTAPVVLTGNVGGTAQSIVVKGDFDINGAKEYIRCDFQPVFSASSVDTATVTGVFVLGGMAILP